MSRHSKLLSRHKTKLKVEKLCRDIEILCHDIIKSSKKETLSRQSFFMSRHTSRVLKLQGTKKMSRQSFLCRDNH